VVVAYIKPHLKVFKEYSDRLNMTIRQPIITIAGHVDHGKTSILDCIRGSSIAKKESGGITQKISFISFPKEKIPEVCGVDKSKIKLEIPGFLFIDTPGHAAFTNLRKRGGSLADLAILVIDINEGIKPQTAEVISILKSNKTPFIIALNKIDNISGWQKNLGKTSKQNIETQSQYVKQTFDEKLFTLIGALNSQGFEADLFYNIKDFTKKIGLIPCSAKTHEGISDLVLMLCGMSQKFLKQKLELGETAKGIILEIKKEKAINQIQAIIYDGQLKVGDKIAIATFKELIITKIKAIHEVLPLSNKFKSVESVNAASGIRIQITAKQEILPGMPFMLFKNNVDKIKSEFKKELSEIIKTDAQGIIAKADSLGSLEALLFLLKQSNIKVVKTGIGNINKSDIISAKTNLKINQLDAVVVGFNVEIDEDAKEILDPNIKILTDDVIYKIIENLEEFRQEKQKQIEKEKLMSLATICKLEILHNFVFRNSNPAIFGVRVIGGKITPNTLLINESAENIAKIKNIQSENKSVEQAITSMEVAISLPGTNFERQLEETKYLYSKISESQFRNFKENKSLLSSEEISILQEIAQIMRQKNPTWGV